MNLNASQHNDRADEFFEQGEYSRALATFQQVFLECGKASESDLRAQVARALHGAARCYEFMDKPDMAAQIRQTLFARYGSDDNPRTRYWIELARGASTPLAETPAQPRDENSTKTDAAKEDPNAAQSWEAFLKANDLQDEPAREEPALERTSQDTPPPVAFAKNESAPLLLSEDEISIERLQEIFEAAFFECDSDGEALRVTMEGARFLIHLDQTNKMIVCAAVYGLRKYATNEEKNELANTLNRSLIFIRFVIHDEVTFVAQYALPYAQGLLPIHLVTSLRLMQRVLTQSVAQYDTNNLLV